MEGREVTGFFWHVHHDVLVEFCYGYDERKEFIRTKKEEHERGTRLHLFQPVKGNLPQEVVETGRVYVEAKRVYVEAKRVYVEAKWACNDKVGRAYVEAWRASIEARLAYYKAGQACDKAGQACNEALKKNMAAFEELHRKECPNCPWNGKTIFP